MTDMRYQRWSSSVKQKTLFGILCEWGYYRLIVHAIEQNLQHYNDKWNSQWKGCRKERIDVIFCSLIINYKSCTLTLARAHISRGKWELTRQAKKKVNRAGDWIGKGEAPFSHFQSFAQLPLHPVISLFLPHGAPACVAVDFVCRARK